MVGQRKAFSFISSRDHCQDICNIGNLQQATCRIWTCAELEFRLSWMKLCSSDNHCTTTPLSILSMFFFTWSVCFCNIEFFRDVFAGNPSFNFHQCCIFHVQCMLHLTSFFLQYSPFLQRHSNNYVCTEYNSVKTQWALRTCAVMISLLTFLKHIES